MTIYRLALTDSNVKRELKEIRRYVTEEEHDAGFRVQLVERQQSYLLGYIGALHRCKANTFEDSLELGDSIIEVCSLARRKILGLY